MTLDAKKCNKQLKVNTYVLNLENGSLVYIKPKNMITAIVKEL